MLLQRGNIMITRRKFIQGVAAGALTAPYINVPFVAAYPDTIASIAKQIPAWTRNVKYSNSNITFPFTKFFQDNYLTNPITGKFGHQLTAVHQNLYEPSNVTFQFSESVDVFTISAHLKSITDLEQLHLFDEYIQRAELSFGCFTLPPGTKDLTEVYSDESFTQILKSLPCHIVLIDAQAIETTTPILPMVHLTDSNKDRILQTAIMGLIEPVFNPGFVGIDFADLKVIFPNQTKTNYLYGFGIGFVKATDNIEVASIDVMQRILGQITLDKDTENRWICWANVCGSENVTMNHYGALAGQVCQSIQEDGFCFTTLTVDHGIGDYIMTTCYLQLELD